MKMVAVSGVEERRGNRSQESRFGRRRLAVGRTDVLERGRSTEATTIVNTMKAHVG
jgi:hypothetical protein